MPTPMSVFVDIAEQYGVDPTDDEAIDRFFDECAPELSAAEREAIVAALLSAESSGESPVRHRYATADPNANFKDDPAVEVPRSAVHPNRDSVELDAIARSLENCISEFFTLAGLDVIAGVNTGPDGKLELVLDGPGTEPLTSDARVLLDSIRTFTHRIREAQPTVEDLDVIVRGTDSVTALLDLSDGKRLSIRHMDITVDTMSVQYAAKILLQNPDREFFVFRDASTEKVSTIYKRRNGEIGLISESP